MKPDETRDDHHEISESDAPIDDGGEDVDTEPDGETSGDDVSSTILTFEDGIRLVTMEHGALALAGSEEQFSRAKQSGKAYRFSFDPKTPAVAAVPDGILRSDGDDAIFSMEFIPVVIGRGDGSNFAVVDYSGQVRLDSDIAVRASLDDGLIVFGLTGDKVDLQESIDIYLFDFAPMLLSYGSGEHFVRGPAEKIIEGELVNAVTHEGRSYVVIPRERMTRADDGTVIHRAEMEEYSNDLSAFRTAAKTFAHKNNTFVFFYNGPIDDRGFNKLVRACEDALRKSPQTKERNRVLLILVTQGGDPHAAYRCARYLWHHFRGYQILIPGWCKSAGTLLAMGADEIYITEFGEIGPIDLQILDKDADFMDSSATLLAALDAIRENTYKTFDHYMNELGRHPSMTLQTRSDISSKLTNEIHASISAKIDPRELGKMHRHLQLCYEYGIRLSTRAKNISAEGVRKLVYDYPQHGFVIDRYEAVPDYFPNVISVELEGFRDILNHISPLSWSLRFPYSHSRQIIETIAAPHANF